jgi:hypothetical protein
MACRSYQLCAAVRTVVILIRQSRRVGPFVQLALEAEDRKAHSMSGTIGGTTGLVRVAGGTIRLATRPAGAP